MIKELIGSINNKFAQGLKEPESCTRTIILCTKDVRGATKDCFEYYPKLVNDTTKSIKPIEANSFDITFDGSLISDVRIHTFRGGMNEFFYPPKAFLSEEVMLHPDMVYPNEDWDCIYEIKSENGRSTDNYLPIILLEDNERSCGCFMSVLWSGDWRISFQKKAETGNLCIRGGLQNFGMELAPGEEVGLPGVILGFYNGDFSAGCNSVREYLMRERIAKFPENKRVAPVSYDHWFGLGSWINEEIIMQQVKIAAGMGFEYFVIDAGWYHNERKGRNDFEYGVGNFNRIDQEKFPNGLKPIVESIRAHGMRPGLWFEPERAHRDSMIAQELPGCMLKSSETDEFYIVDFSKAEALEYTKEYLKRYIEELDLEWIRWDFNINPRSFWPAADRPNRRGETELNYIKGLYEVLEWINQEYPEVLIEGCASGGNRMDLEMMRYCSIFWASDQTYHVHSSRAHLTEGNRLYPGMTLNRALTPMGNENYNYPDYYFMSCFAGAFSIDDPIQYWPIELKTRCAKHVEIYKSIRSFINSNYYSLFIGQVNLDNWEGWEFYDAKQDAGFIMVFRMESKEDFKSIKLFGLKGSEQYRFVNPYSKESFDCFGFEVMSKGLIINLKERSALLLTFSKNELGQC